MTLPSRACALFLLGVGLKLTIAPAHRPATTPRVFSLFTMTTQPESITSETAIDAVPVFNTELPGAELEKIDATEAGLTRLLDTAQQLAALGVPTTRAEYETMHKATMVAQQVRTRAAKLAKEMAQPYGDAYDAIMAEGKRIGSRAKQAEDLTRPLKEQYEEAEKQRRIDEAAAEAERIAGRISSLTRLGVTYAQAQYTLGEVVIDAIEVQAAPDELWQELFTRAVAEAETIAARNREAERLRQEEADRLERQRIEQQAEADRLKAENDRLVQQRAGQQAEIDRQQAELRQQVLDLRVEKLVGLGWLVDGDTISYPNYILHSLSDISAKPLAWFDGLIDAFRRWSIEQAELAEQRRTEQERINAEAIEQARIRDEQEAEQARLQRERELAETKAFKERRARLKADKAILKEWATGLALHPYAEGVKQPETQERMRAFVVRLTGLSESFVEEIDAL